MTSVEISTILIYFCFGDKIVNYFEFLAKKGLLFILHFCLRNFEPKLICFIGPVLVFLVKYHQVYCLNDFVQSGLLNLSYLIT